MWLSPMHAEWAFGPALAEVAWLWGRASPRLLLVRQGPFNLGRGAKLTRSIGTKSTAVVLASPCGAAGSVAGGQKGETGPWRPESYLGHGSSIPSPRDRRQYP